MPDLEKDYEQKNLKIIARNAKKIKALYEGSIIEISLVGSTITLKEGTFLLSKYPQLREVINHELQKLHLGIYSTIVNSIKESWDLSNEKNDLLVDKRLAGKKPTANGERILYDPNKGALDEFIKRKERGMNLSDRVWNSLQPFKTQLEGGLAIGISEGKSAASMAKDLKSYLNDPDRLFRRVRDDNGNLQLSKAAKDFHPGRGVYRSSYKNALRLTATETNIAYTASDQERWLKLPFVIGIKIQTSHNHPEFDICDDLAGVYPKTFVWRRWHPFCICFQTAVQLSDEEYEKYEDKILAGEPLPEIKGITEVPKAFTDYVEKNKDRIEGYKSKPYWYKDNKQYREPKPVKVEAPVRSFTPAKSIVEAENRIKTLGVKEVNLSKINIKQANIVLDTLEKESQLTTLNLNSVDTYRKSNSMAGALYSPSNNSLSINASHIEKFIPKAVETFEDRIGKYQKAIDNYKEKYLDKPNYDQRKVRRQISNWESEINKLEFKVKQGETPKPFTLTELGKDKDESFSMLVTHEMGHFMHYKKVGEKTYFNFRKNLAVSDYGAYNEKEFFAEWYTHWRTFGEKGVPEDLLKLFKEIK